MSTFGDDLVQSLREALADAKGDGQAIVHPPRLAPRGPGSDQPHSGYRKWEQSARPVSGPAATLRHSVMSHAAVPLGQTAGNRAD